MKKIAIVGASNGIGYAIAKSLHSQGAEILAFSRTSGNLSLHENITHYYFDAMQPDSFPVVDGKLDALIYCPGSINLKPFGRFTNAEFQNDLQLNVLGAAAVIQKLLPNLKQGNNASVLLFSTVAVQTGMAFHSSIAMAKGAVEGLTKALAAEFAPSIRVNCIAPSLTQTLLADKLLNTDEKKEAAANRHPLKKIGSVEDCAAMALFLLSENAQWITGQILHVDGGFSTLR
jgi:NAD(P)-dependent dehydrogenase (short-subunit alcohol dehydrogenase family)